MRLLQPRKSVSRGRSQQPVNLQRLCARDRDMETRKLIELLRATIDPGQRQQAEEQLAQASK